MKNLIFLISVVTVSVIFFIRHSTPTDLPQAKLTWLILSLQHLLQSEKCPSWKSSSRMQGAAATRRRLRQFFIPLYSSGLCSLNLMCFLLVHFSTLSRSSCRWLSLPNVSFPTWFGITSKFRVHFMPYSRLFMMTINSIRPNINPRWITLTVKSSVCKEYMQQVNRAPRVTKPKTG